MLSPLGVIPLTASGYRPEEAYLLTLNCLQQMDNTFDDIFNRIDNKAKEQLDRLQVKGGSSFHLLYVIRSRATSLPLNITQCIHIAPADNAKQNHRCGSQDRVPSQ